MPVFNSTHEAVAEAGADVSMIYVPAAFAADVLKDLVGEENVKTDWPPTMGSEDFSFMSKARPAKLAFFPPLSQFRAAFFPPLSQFRTVFFPPLSLFSIHS